LCHIITDRGVCTVITDHINERDAGSKQQCNCGQNESQSGRSSNIALDTLQQNNNNNNDDYTIAPTVKRTAASYTVVVVCIISQMSSASSQHLFEPCPMNALPDYLRNPTLSIDVFKRYLKTFLFAQY